MSPGQLVEEALAFDGQANLDEAVISASNDFLDQAAALGALHQADHCVVTLLQELSQLGDGSPSAARETRDPEEELVLLRRQTLGSSRLLAESQEAPKLIPKLRQPLNSRRQTLPSSRGCRYLCHGAYYITVRLNFSVWVARAREGRMRFSPCSRGVNFLYFRRV